MSDKEFTDEMEKSKLSNILDAQIAIVAEKGKNITRSDKVSEKMVGASTPKTDEKSESKRGRSLSAISSSEDTSESEERRRRSKKTKKKKRYSTSSGDSNSETDYSSSARKKNKHKKTKFNLFDVKTQKEKNKWELPKELAHFYNKHSRTFIAEKDLEELVKEDFPVPNNIRGVPKIDDFITSMWEGGNKSFMPEKDRDLERIHNRIRDVMGPLGSVWNAVETYRSKDDENAGEAEPMDIDSMAEALQKSVMLLSQASNIVTYQRWMETLKSFVDRNAAKNILRQNSDNFETSTKHLFGTEFKSVLKSAAKDSKDASVYFGQKAKKAAPKKLPFRAGSFQKRGDSSSGKGRPMFKRSNQPNSNSNSSYNNAGKDTKRSLPQSGGTTKSTGGFYKCTPFVNKHVSIKKPIRFIRRKDKILPTKLGNVDNRQRSLKHCKRLGNTPLNQTNSTQRTPLHSNDSGGILNSRLRNQLHVGERSHKIGNLERGPNIKQHICSTQNRRGRSPDTKPEGIKPVCTISTLQNGRFEWPENHGKTGGFILQNRSKGCILYNTVEHKI